MSEAILLENKAYWTQRAPGYSEINRRELSTDRREVWKRLLVGRVSRRFADRQPGEIRVLEVGTGPGFLAILLAEAGYRVTAIDLTPSMLEEARRNAGSLGERIAFMEMNAQKLDFQDGQFDVVISRNVTWNLPEPDMAYAEWNRVLKPGGLLLNFDANWYRYLFDDEAGEAYARDRQNSIEENVDDPNVGESFDRMEDIARRVPLSNVLRPEWDLKLLGRLGMAAEADRAVWKRVWTRREKISFASTPMFLVCGYKE